MIDNKSSIIAAVDMGSTKVVVAIASINNDELEIVGLGKAENRGVKQGQIVNMEATQKAIQHAKDEAELMAGFKVSEAYLCIGGEGIQCQPTIGLTPIQNEIVDKNDIRHVMDVAQALYIPELRQVLHVLPLSYKVDNQEGIANPEGMHGVRLEVDAQMITVPKKNLQNAVTCAQNAGFKVKNTVLQQMAAAEAVARDDEKDLGVAVCDMGGGTCDLIVYREGVISHVGAIPVGGLNFTQDIAVGIKTPLMNAESVKLKYGCAMVDMVNKEVEIPIEGLGDGKDQIVSQEKLSKILEARAEETLSLIFQQLSDWNVLNDIGAGLILTGGASQLKGLVELAEYTFDIPVRRGVPSAKGRLPQDTPVFSTAIGMLELAHHSEDQSHQVSRTQKSVAVVSNRWDQLKSKIAKTLSI